MPVRAELTDDIIHLHLAGLYTHEELQLAFLNSLPNPATAAGLLINVVDSESILTRPADQIRTLSLWWAAHGDHFRRRLAYVALHDSAAFGMARMSAISAELAGLTTGVFLTDAAARTWLHNARYSSAGA